MFKNKLIHMFVECTKTKINVLIGFRITISKINLNYYSKLIVKVSEYDINCKKKLNKLGNLLLEYRYLIKPNLQHAKYYI